MQMHIDLDLDRDILDLDVQRKTDTYADEYRSRSR